MFRPVLVAALPFLFACGLARAETLIAEDCLSGHPAYAVEACRAALGDGTDRSPNDKFRVYAALASAELVRGDLDQAMEDFDAALAMVYGDGGATPENDEFADFQAAYARAYLRVGDAENAVLEINDLLVTDPKDWRAPVLRAYAYFAKGDAGGAGYNLDMALKQIPGDKGLRAYKDLIERWKTDPAAAVAACQAEYGSDCGAKPLAAGDKASAMAGIVASIMEAQQTTDLPSKARADAPDAWRACEDGEPEVAAMACDTILDGRLSPEERYAAEFNRVLAALRDDDVAYAITEALRLQGQISYLVATPPADDPEARRLQKLLEQARQTKPPAQETQP